MTNTSVLRIRLRNLVSRMQSTQTGEQFEFCAGELAALAETILAELEAERQEKVS